MSEEDLSRPELDQHTQEERSSGLVGVEGVLTHTHTHTYTVCMILCSRTPSARSSIDCTMLKSSKVLAWEEEEGGN